MDPLQVLPENLKVGFLLDGMSGPPSGAWTRFRALALALSDIGIEVHVLGIDGAHDEAMDLPLKSCVLRPRPTLVSRFFGRREQIDRFARDTGVHLVHLEAPPFFSGTFVPTVASIHDLRHFHSDARTLFTGEALYQLLLLRFHARRVSLLLTLSPPIAEEIHRTLGVPHSRIAVIPPAIEIPMNDEPRAPEGRKRYAVALGHIEPRKNLGVLVAASGDNSWPQDVDLLIVGSDQGHLEELASLNCRTNGKAIFLGEVSDEEKWSLLQGALVVLLPSIVEGFGIVAVEAPLSGAPVLVSANQSFTALGGHPFAFIDTHSPEQWAKAVDVLSRNPKLRSEILSRQRALALNFTGRTVASSMARHYQALVGPI